MWTTSGKILPTVFLIIIPLLAIILGLEPSLPWVDIQVTGGVGYTFPSTFLISIGSLVYGFFPIKFHSTDRSGFFRILIEHDFVKKILYFEIPLLVVTTLIFLIFFIRSSPTTLPIMGLDREMEILILAAFDFILSGLMTTLTFSVAAGTIWMILFAVQKELGYRLAKIGGKASAEAREKKRLDREGRQVKWR